MFEVYWGNDQWTSDVIGSRANPGFDVLLDLFSFPMQAALRLELRLE